MNLTGVDLAAALAILRSATRPQALPPGMVAGSYIVTGMVPVGVRVEKEACHVQLKARFSFTGDLEGRCTARFNIVRRGPADVAVNAPYILVAWGSYAGAVLENSGTFDFAFLGGKDDRGTAQGRLVVLQGSGDLASLRGNITLSGVAGVGGDYNGQVHFDP